MTNNYIMKYNIDIIYCIVGLSIVICHQNFELKISKYKIIGIYIYINIYIENHVDVKCIIHLHVKCKFDF